MQLKYHYILPKNHKCSNPNVFWRVNNCRSPNIKNSSITWAPKHHFWFTDPINLQWMRNDCCVYGIQSLHVKEYDVIWLRAIDKILEVTPSFLEGFFSHEDGVLGISFGSLHQRTCYCIVFLCETFQSTMLEEKNSFIARNITEIQPIIWLQSLG